MLFLTIIIGERALFLTNIVGLSSVTALVMLFLILLLSLKEITIPSKYFMVMKRSLNSVIASLLLLFFMVVVYKLLALGII